VTDERITEAVKVKEEIESWIKGGFMG